MISQKISFQKTSRTSPARLVSYLLYNLYSLISQSNFPVSDVILSSPIALVIWISRGQAIVQL